MHFTAALTVSESKRLIARGIAAYPPVVRAQQDGILAVGSGTTNGYVIEAITGEAFDKRRLVTGRTLPVGYRGPILDYTAPDLVIRRGERLDARVADILDEMGPGDVLIKGANAVNYERGQAAVLIGHPTGGTVGSAVGRVIARRIRFLHPVGLEKSVPGDLCRIAAEMNTDAGGRGPALWVVPGEIFTEIEAVKVLSGARAVPIGSGGIGGAEGAVWFAVFGDTAQLDVARGVLDAVQGEPLFIEDNNVSED